MKTLINIQTDPRTKKDAQKLARKLGLSLSAVLNAYLKQFVRRREVYFATHFQVNPLFERALEEIEEDIGKGKNISPRVSSKKELKQYLSRL